MAIFKTKFTILTLFFSLVCSCKNTCIVEFYENNGWVQKYYDQNWGLIYNSCEAHYSRLAYYNEGELCPDSLVQDYCNGVKVLEGYMLSELPDVYNGQCTSYSYDGSKNKTSNYDQGMLTGEQVEFYPNGHPKLIYAILDGKLNGEYKSYVPDGTILEKKTLRDGKLQGEYVSYFSNGKISELRNYDNDVCNGKCILYYDDGKINEVLYYKTGKLNGECLKYYSNGNIASRRNFLNDVQHGLCQEYYETGQLQEMQTYKNGKLHGEQKTFYPDGKISVRRYLNNDVLHGNFYEYYPNGNPQNIGVYSNGTKTGTWRYYQEDGHYEQYQSMSVRVGARCMDGSRSSATGRGACSHHGGVDTWLYSTEMAYVGDGRYK